MCVCVCEYVHESVCAAYHCVCVCVRKRNVVDGYERIAYGDLDRTSVSLSLWRNEVGTERNVES